MTRNEDNRRRREATAEEQGWRRKDTNKECGNKAEGTRTVRKKKGEGFRIYSFKFVYILHVWYEKQEDFIPISASTRT
jgi:hypothetical protein